MSRELIKKSKGSRIKYFSVAKKQAATADQMATCSLPDPLHYLLSQIVLTLDHNIIAESVYL